MKRTLGFALALGVLAGVATAQDITTLKIGQSGSDFAYYGQSGGVGAFSMATTSCNANAPGQIPVWWWDTSGGGSPGVNQHPVIGQNFFRIANGRIEQLGQSFLKHGFCAVNESGCGSCASTDCNTLGVGCADTYWATLNDGHDGAAKSDINAVTGENIYPGYTPATGGVNVLRGRLQVQMSDLGNSGATYLAEAQYVSEHDQGAGNGRNNASWREINTSNPNSITSAGGTVVGDPAIYAWQVFDNTVSITEVPNLNEGGSGVHGWFFLGTRFENLGGGEWRYEYALQNLTSDRSGSYFSVPVSPGLTVSDVYFRDVDYHSGEPYDNTDWTSTVTASEIRWETTTPFNVDPDGNALRWGTLYNFGFTANASPTQTTVEIGLFKPGTPTFLSTSTRGPAAPPVDCGDVTMYCDPAVVNSTGFPAEIEVSGSLVVADNDLTLDATQLPPNRIGYFLMSQGSASMIPPGAEGFFCLGGAPLTRLLPPVLNSGPSGEFTHSPNLTTLPITAGSNWNFQAWFRDMNPGSTSNFTNAASTTFCN